MSVINPAIVVWLAAVPLLSKCEGLKRFEYITLTCESRLIGPFELVVKQRKVGDTVGFSGAGGDKALTIAKVTEGVLYITDGDLRAVTVNLVAGTVVVHRGAQVAQASCSMETFRM